MGPLTSLYNVMCRLAVHLTTQGCLETIVRIGMSFTSYLAAGGGIGQQVSLGSWIIV